MIDQGLTLDFRQVHVFYSQSRLPVFYRTASSICCFPFNYLRNGFFRASGLLRHCAVLMSFAVIMILKNVVPAQCYSNVQEGYAELRSPTSVLTP